MIRQLLENLPRFVWPTIYVLELITSLRDLAAVSSMAAKAGPAFRKLLNPMVS